MLLAGDTWGQESIVNAPTTGDQTSGPQGQSTALMPDGTGLVAYSGGGSGDDHGIFVRRVDVDGIPQGEPFRVNQTLSGTQKYASIVTRADSTAIVAWAGRGSDDWFGIHARLIGADGLFLSDEFRVNETSWGIQSHPVIAALDNGNFAIAWAGNGSGDWSGVFVRQFDSLGNPVTGEGRAHPAALGIQHSPQIVATTDGGYVVGWSGRGNDDRYGIHVRRYQADGAAITGVLRVNPSPRGFQSSPDLAALPKGDVLVAWSGGGAEDAFGVYVRQIGADHQPTGPAVRVNENREGMQYSPSIATSNDGSFLVLWNEFGINGFDVAVKGRHFQSISAPSPGEFTLPVTVSGQQYAPSVIGDGVGGYLASWTHREHGAKDVYVRRLPSTTSVDSDPPSVSVALSNDTGVSDFDRITFDLSIRATIFDDSAIDSVTVSLASGDGASIDVTDFYDRLSGTLVVPDASLRKLAVEPVADGQQTIRVTATDEFGNAGQSDPLTVTLDTTAPVVPVIDFLSEDTGTSTTDFVTSDARPTIHGTSEPDATVTISEPSLGQLGVIVTDRDGQWMLDLASSPLSDGDYRLAATSRDAAGNASDVAEPITITIDTVAPSRPQITAIIDATGIDVAGGSANQSPVTLRGIGEAGSRIMVDAASGRLQGSTTVDSGGDWSMLVDLGSPIAEKFDFVARSTDAAGNVSSDSDVASVLFDPDVDGIVLTEATDRLFRQATEWVELGQTTGSRVLRLRIDASFDRSDVASTVEDSLLVSLVDPWSPGTTLLDRGENGTSLFMLSGSKTNLATGLVQFDGEYLEIDVTSLGNLSQGQLVFQLVGTDADSGSRVVISEITNIVDPLGSERLAANFRLPPAVIGGPVDLTAMSVNPDVEVWFENLHLDASTNRYEAEVHVRNSGPVLGSDVVVVLRDLPPEVSVEGASGSDSDGNPYLSFGEAIDPLGFDSGVVVAPLRLQLHNPGFQPVELKADVLTRALSVDPIAFDVIENITVAAGRSVRIPLSATDPDGRTVLFSLVTDGPTPTIAVDSTGELVVRPRPEEVGTYTLGLVASVGTKSTRQEFTLTVTADTAAVTRLSGTILDVDAAALDGVPVVLGRVSATSDASGRFMIELPSSLLPSEAFEIPVPEGDRFFDPLGTGTETIEFRRARYDTSTGTDKSNPRQHPNLVTSFLDGSVVYGSDADRASALRTLSGGLLKTQTGVDGELLPLNSMAFFPDGPVENDHAGPVDPASLFVAGDVRSSENPMLASLHTILVREHNRLAREIAAAGTSLDDEAIYQRARKMVGGMLQHITYNEYLPMLLGENRLGPYTGHDPAVDPGVGAFFTTVAFRIGHSQTPDQFDILDTDGAQILGSPLSSHTRLVQHRPAGRVWRRSGAAWHAGPKCPGGRFADR